MNTYMKEHEKQIRLLLSNDFLGNWEHVRKDHVQQIEFLQHERFVHLIITLAFASFMIASYVLMFFVPEIPSALLALTLTIVLLFYIFHYYRLENGVQRWYRLYNEIRRRID